MRGYFYGEGTRPSFLWDMVLDCYDFDAGQPRHLPAGDYYRQIQTTAGRVELELMRLLWRCWLVFKFRSESDWKTEDADFAFWVVKNGDGR